MKKSFLIISFVFFNSLLFAQNDSISFINEFSTSINRTAIKDNNTSNRFGFGLGIYHIFLSQKITNILFGLEYNRTYQHKESLYEAHFANITNVTYFISSISIPVSVRINIGKRIKVFFETGGYMDVNIKSHKKGTMHTYLPGEDNQIIYNEYEINEYSSITTLNIGFSAGTGVKIPISKFHLIIKPEFKYEIITLYDYQEQIYNRYFKLIIGLEI